MSIWAVDESGFTITNFSGTIFLSIFVVTNTEDPQSEWDFDPYEGDAMIRQGEENWQYFQASVGLENGVGEFIFLTVPEWGYYYILGWDSQDEWNFGESALFQVLGVS